MGISVVIPNWNGRWWLGGCLDSLHQQSVEPAEVILVDDGSTDGSVDFVRQHYPEVRIIALPDNRGFCQTINVGIRRATQEALLLLNNDARLHPACLQVLTRALGEFPEADFFALRILRADGKTLESAGAGVNSGGRLFPRGFGTRFQDTEPAALDSETLSAEPVFGNSAGAGLYRHRLFEDIGLFDEDFVMYLEDVDLDFRARLRGHLCLYLPQAIAYHAGSASLGADSPRAVSLLIKNHLFVLAKSLPASLWLRNLPAILLTQIRSGAFYAAQGQALIFARAVAQALGRMPSILKKRESIQAGRLIDDAELKRLMNQ